jgi:rod shape-determining protein MreC
MTPLPDRRRPPLFPRGPGVGLRALVLAALAVALLVFAERSPALQGARQWVADALQPVYWIADIPSRVADVWHRYVDRGDVYVENRELREKQLIIEAQLQKMAALEAENERLRGLLSSAVSLKQRVLVAEILTVSQDPYRHQIVLNKGSADGVYRGQALVDAYGIMGQVIEVNPHSCVALLITDPNHGIPVEINRTGLQTIALGRGDGFGLSLPYLPGNADVKVGDLLVSSGLGGRFPAGYPVGEIHELRHNSGESFMEAIAYPSAHINQGRQALLVWSETAADQLPPEQAAGPPAAGAAAPAPETVKPAAPHKKGKARR